MRLRIPQLPRRAVKLLRFLAVASLLITTLGLLTRHAYHAHIRAETEAQRYSSPSRAGNTLNPNTASKLCAKQNLSPYHAGRNYRKIYDLLVLGDGGPTELDWLEIRLHTLGAYVDYFVIVEPPTTIAGEKKSLTLQEHWERFGQWQHQIIHQIVDVNDAGRGVVSTKGREDRLRDAGFDGVFPELVGKVPAAKDGDVLVVGDVDEVPKPESMRVLRNCDVPRRVTLRGSEHRYSFQLRQRGEGWAHPQATVFGGLGSGTISPTDLRNGVGGHGWFGFLLRPFQRSWEKMEMLESSWHCSFCFKTIAEVRRVMDGLSKQELIVKTDEEAGTIIERVRQGQNLFSNKGGLFDKIIGNQDVPGWVKQQGDRFKYLLDRDGQDAAFEDYKVEKEG